MESDYLTLNNIDLRNKTVLVRSDLNVPMTFGKITSDTRITASLPTYKYALEQGAGVIICSHLGRPKEGIYDEEFSLATVAECLSDHLKLKVKLVKNWLDKAPKVLPGEIVLLENVRFNQGEKACDEALSKKMASMCNIFVMDAFATAHRSQASTCGVGMHAKVSCAGPLLDKELSSLDKVLKNPNLPLLAVIGGAKVSTKLLVFKQLASKCNHIIPGGGIANTFLAAAGYSIGASLAEKDLVSEAKEIMTQTEIPLPVDVVVAKEFNSEAESSIKSIENVTDDEMILDIGPKTRENYSKLILNAGTILCNGPVGVFEFNQFGNGTESVLTAIAESSAFSVAGGGDTVAAIEKYVSPEKISYISTGGGAFLEFMEGKKLPAVDMLISHANKTNS